MIKCTRGQNCNEENKCPFRHEKNTDDPLSKVKKDIEIVLDQIKENKEKINEIKENYKIKKDLSKKFVCVKCKVIPDKSYIIFECLHLLCASCYPIYKVN